MNNNHTKNEFNNVEDNMLTTIVDAILDARTYLQDASTNEWRQILRASCRNHKKGADGAAAAVVI